MFVCCSDESRRHVVFIHEPEVILLIFVILATCGDSDSGESLLYRLFRDGDGRQFFDALSECFGLFYIFLLSDETEDGALAEELLALPFGKVDAAVDDDVGVFLPVMQDDRVHFIPSFFRYTATE